jgi:hypothetical protein
LGKTIALRFEIVRFLKKPALYALKTLNFKLTLPSLASGEFSPIHTIIAEDFVKLAITVLVV